MSCSPFDLSDYFLEELPGAEHRQVEAHVKSCEPCREELDRLRILGVALRSIPDDEIPQRIAFVSDKIFEPSPWRRRLAAFWNSGARLGFAGAAMLSASLLVFALRPATAPVAAPAPASLTQNTAAVSEVEIQQRIQSAVDRAVEAKTIDMTKQIESARRTLLSAAERYEYDQKRMRGIVVASADYGLPASSRVKREAGK